MYSSTIGLNVAIGVVILVGYQGSDHYMHSGYLYCHTYSVLELQGGYGGLQVGEY